MRKGSSWLVLVLFWASAVWAGSVFLKNGYIIQGRIVKYTPEEVVVGYRNGKVIIKRRFIEQVNLDPAEEKALKEAEKAVQEPPPEEELVEADIDLPPDFDVFVRTALPEAELRSGKKEEEKPRSVLPVVELGPEVELGPFWRGSLPAGWEVKKQDDWWQAEKINSEGQLEGRIVGTTLRARLSRQEQIEACRSELARHFGSWQIQEEGPAQLALHEAYEIRALGQKGDKVWQVRAFLVWDSPQSHLLLAVWPQGKDLFDQIEESLQTFTLKKGR